MCRELFPRTRIGPFHRLPYCLRQQGPTPADGPRRNSRPAGKGGRQVTVIQKKQYALDADTCAKYAFHVGFSMNFVTRPKVVPPVCRGMIAYFMICSERARSSRHSASMSFAAKMALTNALEGEIPASTISSQPIIFLPLAATRSAARRMK